MKSVRSVAHPILCSRVIADARAKVVTFVIVTEQFARSNLIGYDGFTPDGIAYAL